VTDKLNPDDFAHTGDDEYDKEHGTVLPTEEQVVDYVQTAHGLPLDSAGPFAAWLIGDSTPGPYATDEWEQFTDPTAQTPVSVRNVIAGAVARWRGCGCTR
jgi:hypothetical protein